MEKNSILELPLGMRIARSALHTNIDFSFRTFLLNGWS